MAAETTVLVIDPPGAGPQDYIRAWVVSKEGVLIASYTGNYHPLSTTDAMLELDICLVNLEARRLKDRVTHCVMPCNFGLEAEHLMPRVKERWPHVLCASGMSRRMQDGVADENWPLAFARRSLETASVVWT